MTAPQSAIDPTGKGTQLVADAVTLLTQGQDLEHGQLAQALGWAAALTNDAAQTGSDDTATARIELALIAMTPDATVGDILRAVGYLSDKIDTSTQAAPASNPLVPPTPAPLAPPSLFAQPPVAHTAVHPQPVAAPVPTAPVATRASGGKTAGRRAPR